jgi:Cu/Ag efflux pump CusA
MGKKLHFPRLSNKWTMPIENRLDMELTGIKTTSRAAKRVVVPWRL